MMSRNRIAAFGIVLGVVAALAIVSAARAEEEERGPGLYPRCKIGTADASMRTIIDDIEEASPQPGSARQYTPPSLAQRESLALGLDRLTAGLRTLAAQKLAEAGFEVCQGGIDTIPPGYSRVVLVYDEQGRAAASSVGRPVLVYREEAVGLTGKGMVLGVPHLNEDGTQDMALNAFATQTSQVRAVVLAGTHRCNLTTNSADDGTTGECGGHYKISDMAHQFDDMIPTEGPTDFQVMHDRMRHRHPDAPHVQLHGMRVAPGDPEDEDWGFEISDGGDGVTNPAIEEPVERAHAAYLDELTTAMNVNGITAAEQTELDFMTTCQAYSTDSDPMFEVPATDRHCGTNSDQGQIERHRGFGDRWLHLEISEYIRNTDGSDPAVFNALQTMITELVSG